MTKKLLVVSSGTTAAGVAREFHRQMQQRQKNGLSELEFKTRCIDTANLSLRGFLSGEWLPLSIDNQFMDTIYENPGEHFPELERFLYPGRLPETTSDGGGGIRYNGAGAIILSRKGLESWIQDSMVALGKMGDRNAEFSVAILVSSVGATGSGTLERLLESVIAAARAINPNKDPQIDVFILQPGRETVTELGLANTVALFAEMAASRLVGTNQSVRRYKGRTILVGWGDNPRLTSIEQLQEAAATLIRVISDPITEIESEYRERAADNHMLHATDPYTHLPSHLSSATAITIGLGNLEEQMIQLDAARLLHGMVLGETQTTSSDEQASPLHDAIIGFLNGDDDASRYDHLLERIYEDVPLGTQPLTPQAMQRVPANQRVAKLTAEWEADKSMLATHGHSAMQKKKEEFIHHAIKEMIMGRRQALATGRTIASIRDDYQALRMVLTSVRKYAQKYAPPPSDNDEEVTAKITQINQGGLFQGNRLRDTITSIQENIRSRRLRAANAFANTILREIEGHCARTLNNLEVILQAARKERSLAVDPSISELPLRIETDDLLHMAALSSTEEIKRYYQQVSIFHTPAEEQADEYLEEEDKTTFDPLAAFRQYLEKEKKLDVFFSGDFQAVSTTVRDYTAEHIRENIEGHSVVDVLLKAGEDVLYHRLSEAADRADSLVSFAPALASRRREERHVCAFYKDEQHKTLEETVQQTFRKGKTTLLRSKDPTEIVVFYYLDGLSMAAVKDLSGRCLDAFLVHRKNWYMELKASQNGNGSTPASRFNQASSIPVYNGSDAEALVHRAGVIGHLYNVRDRAIITTNFGPNDLPELGPYQPKKSNEREPKNNGNSMGKGNKPRPSKKLSKTGTQPGTENNAQQNATTSHKPTTGRYPR